MQHPIPLDPKSLLEMIESDSCNSGPRVSIYFSVPHASDFAMFGKAELRSLVQRAARRMTFSGVPVQSRLEVEAALDSVVTSPSIWENRVDGYAIFASNKSIRCYGLPYEIHRVAIVNDSFYIRPLVSQLTLPRVFYVADISLGSVRLVRVLPESIEEIPLPSGPYPLDDSIPIHNRNFHASRIAHGKNTAGIVVPHGSQEDARHTQSQRYMRHAAHMIDQQLQNDHAPLILLGTESARGHFLGHLTYPHVIDNSISIHLPELQTHTTHSAAHLWKQCAAIVEEWQRSTHFEEAIQTYYALEGIGRATHNVHSIQEYAQTGKVDTLLVSGQMTIDGVLTPEQIAENDAIINTLRHGGRVIEAKHSLFEYDTGAILRSGAYAHEIDEEHLEVTLS